VPPVCPRRKMGFPASLLFCWRPRRDLNPRYRRERGITAIFMDFRGRTWMNESPVIMRTLRLAVHQNLLASGTIYDVYLTYDGTDISEPSHHQPHGTRKAFHQA